jgi:hypothetical protein
MTPDQIYQDLKDLSEKLGFSVSEQSFKRTGIKAQSGFCKVKNEDLFIMDKHLTVKKKIELLAEYIGGMELENVHMMPAIRELLDQYKPLNPDSLE